MLKDDYDASSVDYIRATFILRGTGFFESVARTVEEEERVVMVSPHTTPIIINNYVIIRL